MNDGFIRIDGVTLPTPVEAQITEYDIDSAATGRLESGYLSRERVRSGLLSLQIVWRHLPSDDAQRIRRALSPAAFTVELMFPGGTAVRTMYAGDREWTPDFTDSGRTERWNLSVKLTEY